MVWCGVQSHCDPYCYGGRLGIYCYPYGYDCCYGWPNSCYDPCWGYGNYHKGLHCYDPCTYPCLSRLENHWWCDPCQSYQHYSCYDPCCYPYYQRYQRYSCYDPCGYGSGWSSKYGWGYGGCSYYPKKQYSSSWCCGPY